MSRQLKLIWHQFRFERKLFWHNPTAAFFTMLTPIIFLLSGLLANNQESLDSLIPFMLSFAVLNGSLNAFAYQLTYLKESKILKRLEVTPLPNVNRILGLASSVLLNLSIQIVVILVLSRFLFDAKLDINLPLLVLFVLAGTVCFSALGASVARVTPNYDAAPAYVNAVFLFMILVSGILVRIEGVPEWIRDIGELLPFSHLIDGVEHATVSTQLPHSWLTSLIVVVGWSIALLIFSARDSKEEQ